MRNLESYITKTTVRKHGMLHLLADELTICCRPTTLILIKINAYLHIVHFTQNNGEDKTELPYCFDLLYKLFSTIYAVK